MNFPHQPRLRLPLLSMVLIALSLAFSWLPHTAGRPLFASPAHSTINFITIPMTGHITPVLSLCAGVSAHGGKCNLITCVDRITGGLEWIRNALGEAAVHLNAEWPGLNCTADSLLEGIELMNLASCYPIEEFALKRDAMSASDDFFSTLFLVLEARSVMYRDMLTSLMNLPDDQLAAIKLGSLCLVDQFTPAGLRFCDHLGFSSVVHNPDITAGLQYFFSVANDYNPIALSGVGGSPRHHFRTGPVVDGVLMETRNFPSNLLTRMLSPILRAGFRLMGRLTYDISHAELEFSLGLTDQNVHWRLHDQLGQGRAVLQNSVPGLEMPAYISTAYWYTGPLVSHSVSLDSIANRLSEPTELSFLNRPNDERPIIFVSTGSFSCLNEQQMAKLTEAFSMGRQKFRVIWKQKPLEIEVFARSINHSIDTADWLVRPWFQSQTSLLAHPRVSVFLSHCGINSVHESIWLGVPLLCLPLIADQSDMAQRVFEVGTGAFVDKNSFEPLEVFSKLSDLIDRRDSFYKKNLQAIVEIFELHGGLRRGLELLDFSSRRSPERFVPMVEQLDLLTFWGLDLAAAWVAVGLFIYYFCCRCCCCGCRKSQQSKTKLKTN